MANEIENSITGKVICLYYCVNGVYLGGGGIIMRKKTHEEYVAEVAAINPNIEVVGEYAGATTKILHRCKSKHHEWMVVPSSILTGYGCPKCAGIMKKTHEEYVVEVADTNPNIEVVGIYNGNNKKILHRCKIDGNEWLSIPKNILKGCGCPVCAVLNSANKRTKSHEQYVKELALTNSNIEVVDRYISDSTKILHKCKIDGYEWLVKPTNLLHGKGCPRCSKMERYNHEEYVRKVHENNKDIEVVEKYVNAKTKILHRCKIDGYEWSTTPDTILRGCGCPKCKSSKGENTISIWLNDNDVLYEPQKIFEDCKDKKVLPFDFYLPDYNVVIEYNGRQHYEPIEYFGGEDKFRYIAMHDAIKKDYCIKNNIYLMEIPYFADIYEELDKMYELIIAKGVVV